MLWFGTTIMEDVSDSDFPVGVVIDQEITGPFDDIGDMSEAIDARHDEAEIYDQTVIIFSFGLCSDDVPEVIECEQ